MINTHQAHIFFLALKKILFFEIFLQIPLDLQRDIDRKIEFFSNPKLSVYYMCHMCTNQFYDSDSFIDRYCLKIFNFESIHYRHTIFFVENCFENFLQIPLDSQRDIDRKIELFSNPKLSVYYMCHMCTNQFYDSDSFIDRYCLKKKF